MVFEHPSVVQKIVVICGPTGVGKTGFAIELARRFSGQIVGADSMQIYRRMTIGTAKPTAEEQAAYAREADKVLAALDAQNILPMVVGGTGLYIKALLYGLFDSRPVDPELRRDLRRQAEKEGPEALHRQLARKDPPSAARIHPNDTYRIIRALEILATTGQPLSELRHGHGFAKPRYTALQIGLDMPRDALYHRIDQRVDLMLSQGLEQEVRALLEQGFDPNLKTMQSLGYRHMVAYLQKRTDRQETVRTLKRDHRRYAKRQLTWFRADPGVQWVQAGDVRRAEEMIRAFLSD